MNKSLLFVCFTYFVVALVQPSIGQVISTVAGNGSGSSLGDGGPATAASFYNPGGAYYDVHGNIYVVEYTGNKIRKINTSGIVSTIAGTGAAGFGGDGGLATAAMFHYPIDLLSDVIGNLYIVDNVNQRIRKIDTFGIITTFAGTGTVGYTGDGGPATSATLHDPNRMTIDPAGNIYIADADNNVIRKVNPSGIISTVAGTGTAGFSGDGGPATAATLHQPLGVGFDANGSMFIADGLNHRIRKVTPSGIISTIAGTGTASTTGDGGLATVATLNYPNGIAVDQSCNVYFTDWYGQRVRKINAAGIINTVVGIGTAGFSGDGGAATAAQLNGPNNLTFDPALNLYIPDFYNNRIRKIANLGDFGSCPPLLPTASFGTSSATVCQDSCITVNSTSTTSGIIDSMRWTTVPSGGVISAPIGGTTTICFPLAGTVVVKLRVYGGGGIDSATSTVTVSATPHPHIARSGGTLTATGGPYTGYQWYNGTAIAGATNSTYIFTSGATYWVEVDSNGCKGISNNISTLGIATEVGYPGYFWLSENSSNLTLFSAQSLDEPMTISFCDVTGKRILQTLWDKGTSSKEFNCVDFPPGFYMITLNNHTTAFSLKWLKN